MIFRIIILYYLFILLALETTAQKAELVVPVAHAGFVSDVRFSRDGKLVITTSSGEENLVKIWEAETGRLLHTLTAHTEEITSVTVSPDNRYLLTTGHDQFAKVWDLSSGKLYHSIFLSLTNWIENGFFTPDSKKLVLVADPGMEVHDLSQKKMLRPIFDSLLLKADFEKSRLLGIIASQLTPDGKYMTTLHRDSTLAIWDIQSGRIVHKIKNNVEEFGLIAVSRQSDRVVALSADSSAWVIAVPGGKLINKIRLSEGKMLSAEFSADGKSLLTSFSDKTVKLVDIVSGNVLLSIPDQGSWTVSASFSPDQQYILTLALDGAARLFNAKTGNLIQVLAKTDFPIGELDRSTFEQLFRYMKAGFSHDSKSVAVAAVTPIPSVIELRETKPSLQLKGISAVSYNPVFSADGNMLATAGLATGMMKKGIARVWDYKKGTLLFNLTAHSAPLSDIAFSPDGRFVATGGDDSVAMVSNAKDGKLIYKFEGHNNSVYKCYFTADSRYLVTQSFASTGKIFDLENGRLVTTIVDEAKSPQGIYTMKLSVSGKYLLTNFYSDYSLVTEVASGKKIDSFATRKDTIIGIAVDPNDRFIYYGERNTLYAKEIATGEIKAILPPAVKRFEQVALSPSGRYIATASADLNLVLHDLQTGSNLLQGKLTRRVATDLVFSNDSRYFLSLSYDSTMRIWETASGRLLHEIKDTIGGFFTARFTPGNDFVITQYNDNILRTWSMKSGKQVSAVPIRYYDAYHLHPSSPELLIDNKLSSDIYRYGSEEVLLRIIPTGDDDYLTIDSAGRYDGTEMARKHLYFVCNNEIIELNQAKDELWIPNLAGRIMRDEPIAARGLDNLNLCGLTPQVKDIGANKPDYEFEITPRRGGLGETVLYVNGIEVARFNPSQLVRLGSNYRLRVKRTSLAKFFASGQPNYVTVKSFTANNDISSRSVIDDEPGPGTQSGAVPNLYAVMVGVSDYKGSEMDLSYASKDARDISNAISIAARKLLNTDGKEHVFMYNLTTDTGYYRFPEKAAIKKTFEEISAKSQPNDILLIFFAGHGTMAGNQKQFYFLTAEASKTSSVTSAAEVGISMNELTNWIRPQSIKAQKRILIFDACKSGQAIIDFVKLGTGEQQYMASRDDEKGLEVKAIEKLNEKSGLFILSAAASDQSAYELGTIRQGVLTYSLLRAMKLRPDILQDGKFLDVSRWFDAAEKTVTEIARQNNSRQQPQIVSNTNFNIGIVDAEIMGRISLPEQKPIFTGTNLQNEDADIAADNLRLSRLVDRYLFSLSSRGADSPVSFIPNTEDETAFMLGGRYRVVGNEITVYGRLISGSVVKKFEVKGTVGNLQELAVQLAQKAAELIRD